MTHPIDPIKYEVFIRSLKAMLEEGRAALFIVSGSPAIVEGGEVMVTFCDGEGNGILTSSGTLFHATISSDAIIHCIQEYEENPGIHEGDQFFYNDPYIVSTHVMDQVIIKPIFYQGKRIAWVGTATHTSDCGGVHRGISSEIFHEGVRLRGLKVIEGGQIRKDTVDAITIQCRDPDYVRLDLLGRVASNNVCAEGYLRMVEKFGIEFIEAAGKKVREDAEVTFRERMRGLPDGTWRQRVYISRSKKVDGKEVSIPLRIVCSLTKEGDQITFDVPEASPQNDDYCNTTIYGSRAVLFAGFAALVFWDRNFNTSLIDLVKYNIPEGTVINCRFPASCGLGPVAGLFFVTAAAGCIEKMMYAGGHYEYINAAWGSFGGVGSNFGPGNWYAGHRLDGSVIAPGTYDLFAGGLGAAPYRDGVDTGGIYHNSRSAVLDVEWIEKYYPLLYLTRKHAPNSGGCGKFRGGMTVESIVMAYGVRDLTTDYLPGPEGGELRGFGLFGGYPMGNNKGDSILFLPNPGEDILEKMNQAKVYPTGLDELGPNWGIDAKKRSDFSIERQLGGIRVSVPNHALLGNTYGPGGGYGDPLDRDPEIVVNDIRNGAVTLEVVAKIYGVVLNSKTLEVDMAKTKSRRQEIRQERLSKGQRLTPSKVITKLEPSAKKRTLIRIHEYLEIVEKNDGSKVICCINCGTEFCDPGQNYKNYALRWVRNPREIKEVAEGEEPLELYQEYICPGCGKLLQVDSWCPLIDTDEPVWDIDVKV